MKKPCRLLIKANKWSDHFRFFINYLSLAEIVNRNLLVSLLSSNMATRKLWPLIIGLSLSIFKIYFDDNKNLQRLINVYQLILLDLRPYILKHVSEDYLE